MRRYATARCETIDLFSKKKKNRITFFLFILGYVNKDFECGIGAEINEVDRRRSP